MCQLLPNVTFSIMSIFNKYRRTTEKLLTEANDTTHLPLKNSHQFKHSEDFVMTGESAIGVMPQFDRMGGQRRNKATIGKHFVYLTIQMSSCDYETDRLTHR